MFNLPDVVTELQGFKKVQAFILDGLKDYEKVDVSPDRTLPVVNQDDTKYTRRLDLLTKAIEALSNLISDGHPDPINDQVDQDIYNNLKLQLDQMTAAFGIYSARPEAAQLKIAQAGSVEPK